MPLASFLGLAQSESRPGLGNMGGTPDSRKPRAGTQGFQAARSERRVWGIKRLMFVHHPEHPYPEHPEQFYMTLAPALVVLHGDHQESTVAVPKAIVQANGLSFEARGLLAYLMSEPSGPDWEANFNGSNKCVTPVTNDLISELVIAGYLEIHETWRVIATTEDDEEVNDSTVDG